MHLPGEACFGGAVLNALPGIALRLIVVPAVMVLLDRTKLVPFTKRTKVPAKEA